MMDVSPEFFLYSLDTSPRFEINSIAGAEIVYIYIYISMCYWDDGPLISRATMGFPDFQGDVTMHRTLGKSKRQRGWGHNHLLQLRPPLGKSSLGTKSVGEESRGISTERS